MGRSLFALLQTFQIRVGLGTGGVSSGKRQILREQIDRHFRLIDLTLRAALLGREFPKPREQRIEKLVALARLRRGLPENSVQGFFLELLDATRVTFCKLQCSARIVVAFTEGARLVMRSRQEG